MTDILDLMNRHANSIFGFATTVASLAAAGAAWWAARASADAAKTARMDLAERDKPKIVCVFRLTSDDALYLDVSNFGGVATHLMFEGPKTIAADDGNRNEIYLAATEYVDTSPTLKHGIDALRPGETVPIIVGRYLASSLQDHFALELHETALNDDNSHRNIVMFMFAYTCDQCKGEVRLILDKTAQLRTLP